MTRHNVDLFDALLYLIENESKSDADTIISLIAALGYCIDSLPATGAVMTRKMALKQVDDFRSVLVKRLGGGLH